MESDPNCGVRAQHHNDTSILFLILNPRAFSPSLTAAQQSSIIYLHEFLAEEWSGIGCRIRQLGTREQAPPAAFDIQQLFWPFWIDTWPTEYWHNAALCRQARFGSMVPHQAGLAQTMAHIHVFFFSDRHFGISKGFFSHARCVWGQLQNCLKAVPMWFPFSRWTAHILLFSMITYESGPPFSLDIFATD